MTITIKVENVRGCSEAKFSFEKIALLIGENGDGKTSILKPIGLIASGMVPKKDVRKRMLKDGASRGFIGIARGNDSTVLDVPNDDATTSTGWPKANKYSAGLVKLAEEKPNDLSVFLQKLLKTEPGQNELFKELQKQKVSTDLQNAVWERVRSKGWNDAHKFYVERGRDLKSQWHGISGLTWGSKQAAAWTPKEWEPELDGKSEKTLTDELVQQKETLEGMIAIEAVDENELARLQEEYLALPELNAKLTECAEIRKEREAKLKELTEKLKALPRPGVPPKTYECTHCKAEHVFVNGELKAAPPKVVEDVPAMKKAIADLEHEVSIAGQLFHASSSAERGAQLAVFNAKTAHEKYQTLMDRPKAEKPDPVRLEKQRAQVDRAEKRLAAFRQKTQADVKHMSVMDNQLIIDTLAPEGFRQKHTADALMKFNADYLDAQCKIANCKPVRITKQMDITLGGRLYEDLSVGQQYLVNAVFAIAIARIQKDDILLFDHAECLDSPSKKGLFQMLAAVGIPAVVAFVGRKDQAPDLQKSGIGQTFWCEDGVIKPLKAPVAV